MMGNNAFDIKNLNVNLGNFKLTDINFSVQKGTIMGFIGRNGAGKTTLIKTITDIIRNYSGEILFDGNHMDGNEETIKQNIGVVYDSLIYPQIMNAKSIVKMLSPFYDHFDMEKWSNLMKRFNLNENMKLSNYSKGMQVKFSISMALSYNPQILILDEPTAGLDPEARADILDLLLEFMQDEEKSIFFSTHITSDLDKIADYITLIDNGKIMFSTEKEELLDKYALVHIEKAAMTENLKQVITGIKETAFGYEGLCSSKNLLNDLKGIKIARPSIEDIMIYRGGLHDK
ncbi:MAG: ABC transporter ATP-binding protein [Bacillota bacterium]|nr:ABC transporter ATP-binding protein [Bacillota bacterium]